MTALPPPPPSPPGAPGPLLLPLSFLAPGLTPSMLLQILIRILRAYGLLPAQDPANPDDGDFASAQAARDAALVYIAGPTWTPKGIATDRQTAVNMVNKIYSGVTQQTAQLLIT